MNRLREVPQRWRLFAEEIVGKAAILEEDTHELLISAFSGVPREVFLDKPYRHRATEDCALPVGEHGCASPPSTLARMLGLLGIQSGLRVLEVGCVNGYASAIMCAAGAQVYALGEVAFQVQSARRILDKLGFQQVLVRQRNLERGWPEYAPYDAILVNSVFDQVPPSLIEQLRPLGGRMVAPVGDAAGQTLVMWEKGESEVHRYQLESCNFLVAQ